MALSGQVSVQGTPNVNLVFAWTATQDVKANQSKVDWELQLVSNNIGYIVASPGSAYFVTVDGKEFTGTTDISIETNSTKTLASGSVVLAHEEDGTRKFDFTFSQDFYITVGENYIGVVSGSGSGELDTIEEPEEPEPEEPDVPDIPDEPVDGFDLQSWLTGYILGISGKPYPFTNKRWETIFEGTVATTERANSASALSYKAEFSEKYGDRFYDTLTLAEGTTMRLTVDGDTREYALTATEYTLFDVTMFGRYCGNNYLFNPLATNAPDDDGFGLLFSQNKSSLKEYINTVIYCRTAGNHQIKIERMVV